MSSAHFWPGELCFCVLLAFTFHYSKGTSQTKVRKQIIVVTELSRTHKVTSQENATLTYERPSGPSVEICFGPLVITVHVHSQFLVFGKADALESVPTNRICYLALGLEMSNVFSHVRYGSSMIICYYGRLNNGIVSKTLGL